MSTLKVRLTKNQINFLIKMTEESDASDAMRAFARIMTDEGINPSEMSDVIDIIIKNMTKK